MLNNVDIKAIISRIQTGDSSAFTAVVEHYQHPLFAFLGRMGLSQGEAEELAQETFVRAWRHLGSYDTQRGAFSTWLFTLARNLTLNKLRRMAQQHEVAMGEELPDVACPRTKPLAGLLQAEQSNLLQAAVQQLPLDDRSLLALAYVNGLDLAAIARIEGISVAAVKTRLHRARCKLRKFLETTDE